jgi:hypothetical protein
MAWKETTMPKSRDPRACAIPFAAFGHLSMGEIDQLAALETRRALGQRLSGPEELRRLGLRARLVKKSEAAETGGAA